MKLADHFRLLFQKEKEPFLKLQKILGFLPHDINLYLLALKHKSVHTIQDSKGHPTNNERLEFLGDAILDAVVADLLYFKYPKQQEGYLTNLRSKLVCRESLNKLAVQIGLDQLLLHEGPTSSAHNSYINGNAFEALVGAIYLDRGYNYCKRFIRDVVLQKYINIEEVASKDNNYKSVLIEWCQKYHLRPIFEVVSKQTLADQNTLKFVSRVTISGIYSGQGEGFSIKESHKMAACQALKKIKRDVSFVNQLMAQRNQLNQA